MQSTLWPLLPYYPIGSLPITLKAVWKKILFLESMQTRLANLFFSFLKLFLNHSQVSLSADCLSFRDCDLSLVLMADTKPLIHGLWLVILGLWHTFPLTTGASPVVLVISSLTSAFLLL